ncbi:MAG: ATP synthase subunit I [Veillonellaceae bacterium]|nr:ATP synthase subunit I [Veillonellaceae bacterium]MDD6923560.1 ATP synthase subunit I [Veillonellaceae bacterium]
MDSNKYIRFKKASGRLARLLALIAAVSVCVFASLENAMLAVAFIAGILTCSASFMSAFMRIWKSGDMDPRAAKKSMVISTIVRFLLIIVVFGAAARLGGTVIWTLAGGFGTAYVLIMWQLVQLSRSDDWNGREKGR